MWIIHRLHKKTGFLIVIVLVLICFHACHMKSYYKRATEYVMNHEEEIFQMVEQQEESDLEGARLRWHKDDWTYAEFVLGGFSLGDGSIRRI